MISLYIRQTLKRRFSLVEFHNGSGSVWFAIWVRGNLEKKHERVWCVFSLNVGKLPEYMFKWGIEIELFGKIFRKICKQ